VAGNAVRAGNRTTIANHPRVGNRVGINNRPVIRNTMINNNIRLGRPPGARRLPYYPPRYYGYHHGRWGYGAWQWGAYPAGAAAAGWLVGSAAAAFANPYYSESGGGGDGAVYDYSEPVAAPATYVPETAGAAAAPAAPAAPPAATKAFDAARAAFKRGDYKTALKQADATIKVMPDDAVAHEFRALCLFALGRHDEAAGVLYAVLAAGPGWDWQTMSSLYSSTDAYAKQLKALESHVSAHPKEASGHFVLGYHYLCLGEAAAAAQQFDAVVQIQPQDQVASALLKSLKKS
jgi:tetratricopeptide (TPR) repeat protein